MVDQTIHRRGDEDRQWVEPRSSIAADRMTAIGAQRKHGTLPTDFRSPSENGPSRCGHLTARFAPQPTFDSDGPRVCFEALVSFADPTARGRTVSSRPAAPRLIIIGRS